MSSQDISLFIIFMQDFLYAIKKCLMLLLLVLLQVNKIDFKWDLIKRIKRNAEDWEVDKGKESGINLEYDCVKSFVETGVFR